MITTYFNLLEPQKLDLGGGLFLFSSKLGWIVGEQIKNAMITEENSESSLLASTVGTVPTGIKATTRMFCDVDLSLTYGTILEF